MAAKIFLIVSSVLITEIRRSGDLQRAQRVSIWNVLLNNSLHFRCGVIGVLGNFQSDRSFSRLARLTL